jgi:hypothetical protein
MYSVASVATIATTMVVMAKTSLVFRLKAGIIHFFKARTCDVSFAIFSYRHRNCKGFFSWRHR